MDKVIKEVLKRQKKEKLNDTAFAAKLGISRCMWQAMLHGKRKPGYNVWNAIISTYPDLTDNVIGAMEERLLAAGKIIK